MSKRGNNEGSVYRRRDGRWVGALTLPSEDGRSRRKYFYGKTREEAAKRLRTALAELDRGIPPPSDSVTLGEYLDEWLQHVVRPNRRPKTYSSYEGFVRLHIKPALGGVALSKLTPDMTQRLFNKKLEDLSVATVNRLRATLRKALNDAIKRGLIHRNVAALATVPTERRPRVEPFSPSEARVFLQAIGGHRLEAVFTVAIALGLRRGEALALKWSDIDWQRRFVRIERGLQRIEGRLQFVALKSRSSHRSIALPDIVLKALADHAERQRHERDRAGSDWEDNDLIFCSLCGAPLSGSNVTRTLHRLTARAGLRRQRFHDLRHACASLLLAQGVSPRVVMETLGHSQIGLTMDTYSHVIPELQHEAASRMDDVLSDVGA